MKIALKDTDLFEPDLKGKLLAALLPSLDSLSRDDIYELKLFYDERQVYDKAGIERFSIPEEALLRYLRGKTLSGKEKTYELLSYQLKVAVDCLEKQGIVMYFCTIVGAIWRDSCDLELEITPCSNPQAILPDSGKRGRKEKPCKVLSIMPSMTSFMRNLADLEKREEDALVRAVGSAQAYRKYETALGFSKVKQIYRQFEEEYGSIHSFKTPENEALRRKLLEMLEAECVQGAGMEQEPAGMKQEPAVGQAGVQAAGFRAAGGLTGEVQKSDGKKLPLICTMPIYRLTKSGQRGRACIGYADLVSDGRLISLVYRPAGRMKLPSDIFASCLIREEDERGNDGLLRAVRGMTAQAEDTLRENGCTMETEVVDRLLGFTDMKGMLRKIRRDQILESKSGRTSGEKQSKEV